MNNRSIFSHTFSSYCEWIRSALGKGKDHAGLVYREWFRYGRLPQVEPNAQALLQEIVALTDFSLPAVSGSQSDGLTTKFLIQTGMGEVESVVIPMQAGGTLCISSQVGCRMGCAFCETGRMGLLKQLSVEEITSQVFLARHHFKAQVRNIVFMGMGEPFDNYENVMQAFRILTDANGFGFGHKHITISTSGCVDGIEKLIAEGPVAPNLAVSISAAEDDLRKKLMPVNRKYPLQVLYQTMLKYNQATGRKILTAYVLMKGVNDTIEHAKKLAHYLTGLDVTVNLIPYNPQSNDRFHAPEEIDVENFRSTLREAGYHALVRQTKGQDIMAACGQLGNVELRKTLARSP